MATPRRKASGITITAAEIAERYLELEYRDQDCTARAVAVLTTYFDQELARCMHERAEEIANDGKSPA
jgi:hypothetical protein